MRNFSIFWRSCLYLIIRTQIIECLQFVLPVQPFLTTMQSIHPLFGHDFVADVVHRPKLNKNDSIEAKVNEKINNLQLKGGVRYFHKLLTRAICSSASRCCSLARNFSLILPNASPSVLHQSSRVPASSYTKITIQFLKFSCHIMNSLNL